ncbi:MAG: S1 RNA-binding domain-containing protein, partial [Candidatus Sungbacteria bacterium]|nr:S1 RNA-binding domain-containing protein [Candidatus Sungbacteria bacterium]
IHEKLSKYTVGDTIEGEITGIVNFGAFVTFDEGLEGLVHISEIDWQLIENPGDVLKIGEKVKAKVIEIEGEKISLSLKALKEDPWTHVEKKFHKGDSVKGTVVKYNPFGAFIKLDAEIQGLLHISEFGTEAKMREDVKLNQEYEFKILSIDAREHRLALGIPANHPVVEEIKEEPKAEKEETPKTE